MLTILTENIEQLASLVNSNLVLVFFFIYEKQQYSILKRVKISIKKDEKSSKKYTKRKQKASKLKNLYKYEVPQTMSHVGIYKNNLSLLGHTLGTAHQHPIKLDKIKGNTMKSYGTRGPKGG